MAKPLKQKGEILEDIAQDIYNNLVNTIPHKRPEKVILYGAPQSELIQIMCLATGDSRRHKFNIQPGELNGEYAINVGDKYLEKLAFLCKENFYSLSMEKRKNSILVEGGSEIQREKFRNNLINMVDVFVSDKQYYPVINGEHIINLDDYF